MESLWSNSWLFSCKYDSSRSIFVGGVSSCHLQTFSYYLFGSLGVAS